MPSDPSTKDLIEAAREKPRCSEYRAACLVCAAHALADRLEEVEEERARLNAGYIRATSVLRSIIRTDRAKTHEVKEILEEIERDRNETTKPPRSDSNDAEPSDPEPEDDPWEAVERIASGEPWTSVDLEEAARALLDLRKRVEETEDHGGWAGIMAARITALSDRLTTLEGHADRGSEAEAELRGRVTTLEYREEAGRRTRIEPLNDRDSLVERVERLEEEDDFARKVRGTLRDDLEKIDDFTEALAERVERLEARADG